MRHLHRHETKLTAVVVSLAFVALGCSGPAPQQGVKVRALTTDVGLGAEKVEAPTSLPNTDPIVAPIAPPKLPTFKFAPLSDRYLAPPVAPCAEPAINDFPKEAATPSLQGKPKEGTYIWKSRYQGKDRNGRPFDLPIFPDYRIIASVKPSDVAPGAFTYRSAQFDLGAAAANPGDSTTTIIEWLVVPRSPSDDRNVESDAGEGIFITAIAKQIIEKGQSKSSVFQPVPPLQILKFPVSAGDIVDTTGVDAQTKQTLTITGRVQPNTHLNVCGGRIDSWLVKAEQITRFGDQPVRTQRFDYAIATQFGGIIVHEHVADPKVGPVKIIESTIGAISPIASDED